MDFYKIVETIEHDEALLSIAPAMWENDGKLMWPPSGKVPTKKLKKTPLIPPGTAEDGWTELDCTVERSYIPTYIQAQNVMREMSDKSGTSDADVINAKPMAVRRTAGARKIVPPIKNADSDRKNYNEVRVHIALFVRSFLLLPIALYCFLFFFIFFKFALVSDRHGTIITKGTTG